MFPHMGLTAGPLLGQVLAALVEGRDPGRELDSFAPDRFSGAQA
jgi:glycine/D-amino acid oxidase-like deaminating enzyme